MDLLELQTLADELTADKVAEALPQLVNDFISSVASEQGLEQPRLRTNQP